ncbi:DUF4199 domain-containing protein [uncultured Eudoraea sp.]|uniref:DUF4199 domain-containing protein n=1 Tax=uncultured Eudoraea sp. TaxID=1035614 RepID=UPI00260305FA|nr:DUF4199 domain-containing protein [uncultured Eudoraea sp.]
MRLKTILKWGILLGVSVALGTQILTWLGLGLTNWFVLLTYILVIVFSILSLTELRNRKEIKLNFLNAILVIIGIVLISRLIFQTYMFIYTRYLDPSWVDTVSKTWTISLQESNVAANEIEQQINSFRKSYEILPMFTSSLISYAIPQFVIGIIVSIIFVFTNKKKSIKKST